MGFLERFSGPEWRLLMGMLMFLASMVRFMKSTGPQLKVELSLKRAIGHTWTPYATPQRFEQVHVTVRNAGSVPVVVDGLELQVKGARGGRARRKTRVVTPSFRARRLPFELDPRAERHLSFEMAELRDWFDVGVGEVTFQGVVRDGERGRHRSNWLTLTAGGGDGVAR